MRYREISEDHHAYDDPDFKTKFKPILKGDTVRVFHGFREFTEALSVAANGTSGKLRVPRVYSYESDNNPKGIFVSLSRKVAADFVGSYGVQAIVEFNAAVSDLDAPVWPGGSYTVQGGYAQYFGHGAKGRAARKERGREAERETEQMIARDPEGMAHIAASDSRYLASMMTNSREFQALFVGDLSPSAIIAWHVRPKGARHDDAWERISPEEFQNRYGSEHKDSNDRMFNPGEAFNGDQFVEKLANRFTKDGDKEGIFDFCRNVWSNMISSDNKTKAFIDNFGNYLWPNQYIDALKWLRNEFGPKRG